LLSASFRPLAPSHWRRVPPLSCISSFVRLLQVRQPDNTMASTVRGSRVVLPDNVNPPGSTKIENEDERDWGLKRGRGLKGKRIRINEVPLDYSAEMGRLTGKGTGILPARSYAEVPDDGFLHA
jgi:hypothetical protein